MRRRRRQLACVLSSLALVLMGAAPARPSVVDGDTFILGADRIRLWGVDAPEGRQVCQDGRGQAYRCGDMARDQLKALIGEPATAQTVAA